MNRGTKKETSYIIDANVLIDYQNAGHFSLLSVFAVDCGPLFVSSLTPEEEVCDLLYEDCETLGLEIIEPEPFQCAECNGIKGISFADAVNLILARDYRLTLITNDRPLWRAAKAAGIHYMRGLRILLSLVECGSLKKQKALSIAECIRETNPQFINSNVMNRFKAELHSIRVGALKRRITQAGSAQKNLNRRKNLPV